MNSALNVTCTFVRLRTATAGIVATVAIVAIAAWPYVRVASFVVRAVGRGGWLDQGARAITVPVLETSETIPTRYGPVRGRLYRPTGRPDRTALLVSGMHGAGIDEPRLIRLAREVAATGWGIVTPELSDLIAYRMTPRATDIIEDAGVWLAGRHELVPDGRIGLLGISFAGGLSIVAAGRASLREHTRFVFSFGGHGDLPRVLRYLCTGIEPDIDGERHKRPAHDYGLAIVTSGLADRLVPPDQVEPFRHSVGTFLKASGLALVNTHQAEMIFAQARELERGLPQPAETLMHYVNERNVSALGNRLLPYLDGFGNDPSLSPDRSAPPNAAVFLLHGTEDNVIPAVETRLLGRWLQDKTPVRVLFSNPITHVNVTGHATLADYWGLISFWRALLAE